MSSRRGIRILTLALAAGLQHPGGAQELQGKGGAGNSGEALPAGAVSRIGTNRLRHGLEISELKFSPDGLSFASSSIEDGCLLRLWDVGTGKEIRKFEPVRDPNSVSSMVNSVAFSPDGRFLAGVTVTRIHLWDLASGRDLLQMGPSGYETIGSIAFSPDGTKIAAAGQNSAIRLYEVATGKDCGGMKSPKIQQPYGMAMSFSPDGKLLATGGEDRQVHLWDAAGGQERITLVGHGGRILTLAWSPDGKTLATGSSDKTVRIWDAAGGQQLFELKGHRADVSALRYSPDGRTLNSSDFDSTVRVWDALNGAELRKVDVKGLRSNRIVFSPDGKKFLRASHAVISLHDVLTGKEISPPAAGHAREIQALSFAPDGRTLYSQGGDDTIRSWSLASREETNRISDHVSAGGSFALSGDGRALAVGSWDDLFLVDVAEKKERWRTKARSKGTITLAFSPDGKTLAWATGHTMNKEDHDVHLASALTGEELRKLHGHEGMVTSIAFAADGKTIATASAGWRGENSIRFWDPSSGAELRKFQVRPVDPNQGFIRGFVAFSSDLSVIGSSDDRSLALRDGVTGKEFARLACGDGLVLSCAAFSPDGRSVAVSESRPQGEGLPVSTAVERIGLWEVATGSLLSSFENGQGSTRGLAFSPDGKTLVSGGHDSTILFWDLLRPAAKRPSSADVVRLWEDLADPEGKKAWQAIAALVAGGDEIVKFVAEHLRPALMDAARVRQWIHDLSSPNVAVQLKAGKMLGQSLDLAGTRGEIQKALDAKPPEDVRVRLEALLGAAQDQAGSRSPEELRRGRALHLLEQMATKKATDVLRALAEGEPSRLSREARAALGRIEALAQGK